jgi:hypothetical protein
LKSSSLTQGVKTVKSARLQTNLVGRKIHLLTDEEARDEARKQTPPTPLKPEELEAITAESWYPALKGHRQRFGDQSGEIVAVHLADRDRLVYTISFGGQLVELNQELWRLDPV